MFLQKATGLKWAMVAYRSAGPALQDVITGNIDIALDTPATSKAHIEAGNIKAFAVTSKARIAAMPNLPTVEEAGVPGYTFSFWHALWAPKGIPAEALAQAQRRAQSRARRSGDAQQADRASARRSFPPTSRRRKRSPPSRRPRSSAGGRSSRPPGSSRSEAEVSALIAVRRLPARALGPHARGARAGRGVAGAARRGRPVRVHARRSRRRGTRRPICWR